jgi:hypothetical protein
MALESYVRFVLVHLARGDDSWQWSLRLACRGK